MALVLLRCLVCLSDLMRVRHVGSVTNEHVSVERIEVFDLTFNNVLNITKATNWRNAKRAEYYVSLSSILLSLLLSNVFLYLLSWRLFQLNRGCQLNGFVKGLFIVVWLFQNSRCLSLNLQTFKLLLHLRYLGFISRDHFIESFWILFNFFIVTLFFRPQFESVLVLLMLSYDLQEPHLTVVFHWREQAHWYEHEEGVRTKVCPVEELYVHDRDDVGDRQANVVRLAKLLWQRLQLPVLRAVSDGCGDSSEQAATSD